MPRVDNRNCLNIVLSGRYAESEGSPMRICRLLSVHRNLWFFLKKNLDRMQPCPIAFHRGEIHYWQLLLEFPALKWRNIRLCSISLLECIRKYLFLFLMIGRHRFGVLLLCRKRGCRLPVFAYSGICTCRLRRCIPHLPTCGQCGQVFAPRGLTDWQARNCPYAFVP